MRCGRRPPPRRSRIMDRLLPRFYPIVDTALTERRGLDAERVAALLIEEGAGILQIRHKGALTRDAFHLMERIRIMCTTAGTLCVINDRADVAALLGACTNRVPFDDVKLSSRKRWSMLTLCVTEPVFISVTRAMFAVPTETEKFCPGSIVSGALTMAGRAANAPLEL